MLYLYLGYVVIQFYAIFNVFTKNTVAPSAVFFSLIVFVIWSFVPIIGYAIAKAFGACGQSNKTILVVAGMVIALIENSFTYFNLIEEQQYNIVTIIVFILFFIVAYLPLSKAKTADLS